jgi:peptide/nickel transport system substrate-binding protein
LEKAFFNQGFISHSQISRLIAWANNPDVKTYEYDLTKADELLDEAGIFKDSDGNRFELSVKYDVAILERQKTAEIWKEDLKKLGIDLKLEPLDKSTWLEEVYTNWDFDMIISSAPSGPDPVQRTSSFHSDSIGHAYFQNAMGYNNSRVDELLDLAKQEQDKETMVEYLYEIQDILVEDLPAITFWDTPYPTALRDEFVGEPYYLTSPDIFEELDHIWWKFGTLPEEEEEPVSEVTAEDIDAIVDSVNQLISKVNSAEQKITSLESDIDELQSATPGTPLLAYGIGIIALLVALAAIYLVSQK